MAHLRMIPKVSRQKPVLTRLPPPETYLGGRPGPSVCKLCTESLPEVQVTGRLLQNIELPVTTRAHPRYMLFSLCGFFMHLLG